MTMNWHDDIEERKDVLPGKPIFKGTRLTVEHVLRQVGSSRTDEQLLEQSPTLRLEHIRATALDAADLVTLDQSICQ